MSTRQATLCALIPVYRDGITMQRLKIPLRRESMLALVLAIEAA